MPPSSASSSFTWVDDGWLIVLVRCAKRESPTLVMVCARDSNSRKDPPPSTSSTELNEFLVGQCQLPTSKVVMLEEEEVHNIHQGLKFQRSMGDGTTGSLSGAPASLVWSTCNGCGKTAGSIFSFLILADETITMAQHFPLKRKFTAFS